jgi:hypothetical protein
VVVPVALALTATVAPGNGPSAELTFPVTVFCATRILLNAINSIKIEFLNNIVCFINDYYFVNIVNKH